MRTFRTLPRIVALTAVILGLFTASTFASVPPAENAGTRAEVSSAVRVASESESPETRRASEILTELKASHSHLDGVSVSIGTTPKGEEAVAYYTDGEIVINSTHSVDMETILAHEIWHIIDWRDNGRLDWGEDLPPLNASVYYR